MSSHQLSASLLLGTLVLVACATDPILEVGNVNTGGSSVAHSSKHASSSSAAGASNPTSATGGTSNAGGSTDARHSINVGGSTDARHSINVGGSTDARHSINVGGSTDGFGLLPILPTCESVYDETGSPVEIVVTNQRSEPIYVGDRESVCNFRNEFAILDESGTPVPHETDSCYTCEKLLTKGPCAYSCGRNPLTKLEPGASLTLHWDGTFFIPQIVPATCQYHVSESCPQPVAAASGSYTVRVIASSDVGCVPWDPPLASSNCDCVKNNNCESSNVNSAYGTGEKFEATAQLQVPGTTKVSVTFTQ